MPGKILLVTGAREGDGKTTLAVNTAVRYSQFKRQPAVVIDMDEKGRGEAAHLCGMTSSTSVVQLLDQLATKQITPGMLRGRIPLGRHGIGVLPLGSPREIQNLKPEQWTFFLELFSQHYDLVLDMDMPHALKTSTLDIADVVFWVFKAHALSVRSTIQSMGALLNEKFGFHRFRLFLNQETSPHPMNPDTIQSLLDQFTVEITDHLPYEPEIEKLLSQNKPAIIDQMRSPYVQAIQQVLEQTADLQKERAAKINLNVKGLPGNSASMAPNVVDSMANEKRKQWNIQKQEIHRELVEELNIRRIDLDTKGDPVRERQLRTNVESTVNALIAKNKDIVLTREEREVLVKELVDEALGLGPLEELLRDTNITEIMVNRADQVFIERKGKITLSDKRFIDNNHVVQVIRRIISPLGRRIDESVPLVDARLKDGSRVNAIIPPLAVSGPSITIRRFPEKAFNASDLISFGAINQTMIDFLKICVLLKKNMVISGGTGTGKTTILNMLSSFIPTDERIVTVEDTAELRLQQEHVVRLEARPANIEGQGLISIRDLVKNCLRMRPDRIVVGECRGGEALDMLQAMNTGHEGSLTTVHANTPRDCFTRLETLCLMAGMDLPVWALREQIKSAVHIVVQLTRMQDGSRKVTAITEITGRDDEHILSHDLFRYVQDGMDANNKVIGHHEATGEKPLFLSELKSKGLSLDEKIFLGAAA